MYKLFLILRYLRRKLAPMFAALAVTLCVAMVIIVISVMGGFLDMMRSAAQRLTGQVSVVADITGMSHHDVVLDRLRERPEVAGATPVVRALGLIKVHNRILTVEVMGVEPGTLDEVLDYGKTLHWTTEHLIEQLMEGLPEGEMSEEQRQIVAHYRQQYEAVDPQQAGRTLTTPPHFYEVDEEGNRTIETPAMVPGIEVMPWSARDDDGEYDIRNSQLGEPVTLTVLPLTASGTFDLSPSVRTFTVVNEFKSGLHEIDANRVYVDFKELQQMLDMAPEKVHLQFNPETGEGIGEPVLTSGRASEIMVRGAAGVPLDALRKAVEEVRREVASEHPDMTPTFVITWQERHQTLLNAVEKEKGLLTLLFAIISITAIVMIGVIFYMIVLEKTRDIGTLRAIGAGHNGVASIFIGYGLAIGIVGSLLGLALAAGIVWNLNEIQTFLYQWFGFRMWDPKVYYFETIPNRLNPTEVTVILVMAVCSSVAGAIIPAWKAARLNPVEALRYE